VLRHQLGAALREDLGRFAPASADPTPATFGELLHHPDPPLELLEGVRRFAKAQRDQVGSALPEEVAAVLYYAAIVAARLRCRQRLSHLDDDALAAGLRWALGQPWLDDPTRTLLRVGLDAVAPGSGSQCAEP
jgi:hypothetical protein